MPDSDKLVEKLRVLTETVAERAPKEASIIYQLPKWTFDTSKDGMTSWEQVIEDRIYWSLTNVHEWLASLPPYADVERLLCQSAHAQTWVETHVTGPDPVSVRRVGLNSLIRDLILNSLEVGAWRISEERWAKTIRRLRSFLEGRTTHQILAFLHGVGITIPVNIGGIVLRRPTRAELLAAYNVEHEGGPNTPIISCEAVIEGTEELAFGRRSSLMDRASAIIAALRIWTHESVVSISTYEAEARDALLGSLRRSGKHFPIMSRPCALTDASGFSRFVEQVGNVLLQPPKSLAVALRRRELMAENERSSDRTLDLFIILEALLLNEEKSEISYRLALRAAHFAGDDREARERFRKAIKKGYDLRSKIAHGATPSPIEQTIQSDIEGIASTVLRRYCERASMVIGGDVHKTIIDELESYLLERREDVARNEPATQHTAPQEE